MDQESELNDLPEKKLATMRDVARAAGVSVSTVSRVLDERLPTSRSASAEKIRQVARELGYRRDYVACLLYTSPSPRDPKTSRMPSSA